jgi:hypothetical protein
MIGSEVNVWYFERLPSNPHNTRKSLKTAEKRRQIAIPNLWISGGGLGRNFRTPEISCLYRSLRKLLWQTLMKWRP